MDNMDVEFQVLIEGTEEVIKLVLDKDSAERAKHDDEFLRKLILDLKNNANNVPGDSPATNSSNESVGNVFTWPDAAVRLLMEVYRDKEDEFKNGMKRHNIVWREIADVMKDSNYNVNGLQCSNKFAGLRRTYKNIKDQNKKSGNFQNSWAFYSAMDSLIGDRASINPPAEASSEGPPPPTPACSSASTSSLNNAPKKRKLEVILDKYLTNITTERERMAAERAEERRIRNELKEKRHQERKMEREKMHKENIEIQKSLISVLQTLANKK